ncbi:hypothetical protein N8I84_19735 [Streptomyces cynarae]|uniref:Uncharacterized protein n=1 Tax=Streptomyces cynarae TaxID=2981134 RepID=A0ABY6E270_9ACTN|nr:hypothetical protein [Streptomyces cynarae]UXY20692.1 hypothetical protein N8I84_19735 [Streptomyces cynarae]
MREVEYESHGCPLEDYQLTRGDHRQQEQSENIERWVEKVLAAKEAEERADPVLAAGRRAAADRALDMLRNFKTAEREIMRWRVRLYCGHIVETRRHCENRKPTLHGSSSMQCPECGKDPSAIVAFEPIGLAGEPRSPVKPAPSSRPKRLTRTELERRVAALEKEIERLRAQGSGE